jgi:hypothetical protein
VRRRPNPWIAIPSVALGLLAGGLAWVVTSVSCELDNQISGCVGWSLTLALASLVLVAIGTAVILVLVFQSLAEWREGGDRK